MNLKNTTKQQIDLPPNELFKLALERGEGVQSANGALTVTTGKRTGRSPNDKFIVKDPTTENTVDWGKVNKAIEADKFANLWRLAEDYLQNRERDYFISHLMVGHDSTLGVPVKVITETAWHQLFAHHLFISLKEMDLNSNDVKADQLWTIINAPGLLTEPDRDGTNSDGAVMINFTERKVLICGMRYAGEMKKAMFSVLNFLLPERDVLPMHCAANVDESGDNVALFFGLSGTGKTTLSSDPDRYLIGDDEHGWGKEAVFNFEGGCYAKCIDLSEKTEPVIWNAIRHGAIMENVVLDPTTKEPDFTDDSLTQNTRAAYPLNHIEKAVRNSRGKTPRAVLFLSCDLYGVLPPVSLLTKEQAAYYFLSGYTAKVGSTEIGSTADVQPTFSPCFGEPFFPRKLKDYSNLLIKRLKESNASVYLINTGWQGGSYGKGGERFSIATTRQIIKAAVTGATEHADYETLPGFNLLIPKAVQGIDDSRCFDPRNSWKNSDEYKENAQELIKQFNQNFTRFTVDKAISEAGPKPLA